MRADKKFLVVLAFSAVTVVLYSSSADAQVGPGNPSGGSALHQTREEGATPVLPTDYLSRGVSLNASLTGWLVSVASTHSLVPAISERAVYRKSWMSRRRAGAR